MTHRSTQWKCFAVALLATLAVAAGATTQAADARSMCSDLGYLNAGVKGAAKHIAALKLANRSRYSAALKPARTGLRIFRSSPVPCDEDGYDYWLHRQYSIKYSVALVRYLEEMRDRDYDRADIYWSSVVFWGDEMRDISLGW